MIPLSTDHVDWLTDQGFDPHWLIGWTIDWHGELLTAVWMPCGELGLPLTLSCGRKDCPATTDEFCVVPGLHRGAWPYVVDPATGEHLGNLRDQEWRCEAHR